MKKPRIRVFVCHCGGNISDTVDIEELLKAIRRLGLEKHCLSPANLLRRLSPLDHPASVSIAGGQP